MEPSELQQLQREVRELKAEVRRTRHLVEGTAIIAAIGISMLVPDFLIMGIAMGVLILFGFIVSPMRRLIFQSLSEKRKEDEFES